MIEKEKLIFIGKILKTTGLNGSLKIKILSDFPDRYDNLKSVYIFNDKENALVKNRTNGGYSFEIENHQYLSRELKLKFTGFDTIEDSRELAGNYICIDESERMEIKEGHYYFDDLLGTEVFSGNECIGTVTGIENYGGDDLLVIKNNNRKKEVYLPFRREFIESVELSDKRIKVKLIEGII